MRLLDALLTDQGESYLESLPHGSGIDYDWQYSEDAESVTIYNGFHAMDANGFYSGTLDFSIRIPRDEPDGWALAETHPDEWDEPPACDCGEEDCDCELEWIAPCANGIVEYLNEALYWALTQDVDVLCDDDEMEA